MTSTVRVPLPNRGDGYKVLRGLDGRMTTVPMHRSELALYATDRMAMDAAPIGGPKGSPDYASYNATGDIDDINEPDGEGFGLEDKIRQLLEGKLDDADVEMLIKLIQPDDTDTAPAAAQDRRGRRLGHDQRVVMPSKAEMLRRIAASGEVRAARAVKAHEALLQRFPALKNARVGG